MAHLVLLSVLTFAALFATSVGTSVAEATRSSDNPIRRVVTMLQNMQAKVVEEGKRDAAIHEKYMCYCSSDSLEKAIAAAEKRLTELESDIKEFTQMTESLAIELQNHQKVRAEANKAIKEATAVREKEAAIFTKESTDKKKDLAAMGKAITALEKGMTYEFLQTETAVVVQRVAAGMELSTNEREVLEDFFANRQQDPVSDGYNPASGQIVGLIKQMKSDMEKEVADLTASEEQANADFQSMMGSKNKEVAAASQAIQEKQTRLADASVQLQTLEEENDDTALTLEQDKKFFADKDANCATAVKDYEVIKKTRAEELVALSETIKLLNDDDALELFKKTLPSPSLLQVKVAAKQTRERALEVLHGMKHHHDSRLDFIALALHGKKVSFDKVLKMIDEMTKLLDKEQSDDDLRHEVCVEELDKTEDKLKTTETAISSIEKAIAEDKDLKATTEDEVHDLTKGIKKLDKDVTEATETRKDEHDDYEATLSENKAAKDLLLVAKNRLNKFYNPTMYSAPPKDELSAQEQIAANMGVSFLQQGQRTLMRVAVHAASRAMRGSPPPEAVAAYKVKTKESNGVIEMINMLVTDLDKEIKEQEVAEKDAQSDYENFIEDSADKRTKDGKSISLKERTAAELETELVKLRAKDKAKLKEAYATTGVLGDLHQDCDWLLANFNTRKQARASEKESLQKAKGILSGMDVSLMQVAHKASTFLGPK